MWPGVCETIGRPELMDDPRFATVEERRKRSAELAAILSEAFASRDYEHWRKTHGGARHHLRRHQPAAGRARRPAGRGLRRRRRDRDPRDAAHPGQSDPPRLRRAADRPAAPALGQHSDEILAEAGLSRRRDRRPCTASGAVPMSEQPMSGLPLSGLVVLDISSFIAAPAAAVALADFGADVIKIEPPGEGDPHRHNYRNASYPQSDKNFPWQLDGRLKRSMALDLKNDERARRARATDRARRRHDRELPAAGARTPEAALGGHRAASIRAWSIARSPATARPVPTATGRASTSPPISAAPASSTRRATRAARPACRCPPRATAPRR